MKWMKWSSDRRSTERDLLFLILLLAPAFLWFHGVCNEVTGDTVIFLGYLREMTIPKLLKFRMEHFTTRVILEALLFIFLKLPAWCFALADTAVILLTAGLLGYYGKRAGMACFGGTQGMPYPFLLAGFLFLLYPLGDLTAAGIPPAFINYVWSGCFGLLMLLPSVLFLKEEQREHREGGIPALLRLLPLWLLSAASGLVGANMEQMALLLFLVTGVFLAFLLADGKRGQAVWMSGLWGLSSGSLLFHLTGGNAKRTEISIEAYWPEFRDLTITDKVWNGIFTTTNHLLSIPNLIFLSFAWLLALLAVTGQRGRTARTPKMAKADKAARLGNRAAGLSPGGRSFQIHSGKGRSRGRFPEVLWYTAGLMSLVYEGTVLLLKAAGTAFSVDCLKWLNGVKDPYTDAQLCPAGAWLPLAGQLTVLLLAVLFLCMLLEDNFQRIIVTGLLAAGFVSRMAMGFSPTLFMSHTRTFYFFYLAILTVDLILAAGLWRRSPEGYRLYFRSMAALGIANFIRSVLKAAELMSAMG